MTKDVFVLGSGFSKYLYNEMPLLNDLTECIIDMLKDENQKDIRFFLKELSEKEGFNFEQILTFLYQEFPWKSDYEKHNYLAYYHVISEKLAGLLSGRQKGFEAIEQEKDEYVRKLISYWHRNESAVITLNYDTLLEQISKSQLKAKNHTIKRSQKRFEDPNLEQITIEKDYGDRHTSAGKPVEIIQESESTTRIYFNNYNLTVSDISTAVGGISFGSNEYKRDLSHIVHDFETLIIKRKVDELDLYQFAINPIARRTHSTFNDETINTYHLIKLHGSINWYYSGSKDSVGEQLYLLNREGSRLADINIKDLSPMIIPPVLDKSYFFKHNSIKQLWAESKNALNNAERVFIIGYSIPATDLTVKYMLQRYVNKDCKVCIINIDEKKKEYFRQIFKKVDLKYCLNDASIISSFIKDEID